MRTDASSTSAGTKPAKKRSSAKSVLTQGTTAEGRAAQKAHAASEEKRKAKAAAQKYPIFDEEAFEWVMNAKIPGTFSPHMFLGRKNPEAIADALGRSITLKEAQYLVQLDGKPVKCQIVEKAFQPIKYLAYVPDNLKEQLDEMKKPDLTKINFAFGGAFYVNVKNNMIEGFSGSVYCRFRGHYQWSARGALVMMALAGKSGKKGRPDWGITREAAEKRQAERTGAFVLQDKVRKLRGNYARNTRRPHMGALSAAFESAEPLD